ncbi:MAG: diaminopimelate epimerase [Bacteroidota bacterium]
MKLQFYKYQGTGNDFVLFDNRELRLEEKLTPEQIAWLCDRRFGIGADGLMLLTPSAAQDFKMIYYNSDGNESTMCGNGGRCIMAFAHRMGMVGTQATFEAIDGLHQAEILSNGEVRLEMIQPYGFEQLSDQDVWLHTGSPHYLRFVTEEVAEVNVDKTGRELRHHPKFTDIGGTNVNFVKVMAPAQLSMRTYERGVEAETLSCGTGVTAAAYAYLKQASSPTPTVGVTTPGGNLQVHVQDMGNENERVFLQGPGKAVFQGEIEL